MWGAGTQRGLLLLRRERPQRFLGEKSQLRRSSKGTSERRGRAQQVAQRASVRTGIEGAGKSNAQGPW